MTLDPAILARLRVSIDVTNYVRIIARVYAANRVIAVAMCRRIS